MVGPPIPENPVLQVLWEALQENWNQSAPITYSVIGFVLGIFAVEVTFTLTRNLESIRVFATG